MTSASARFLAPFLGILLVVATPAWSQYQDPGAQQDAEAAREKLLKAADQLDNIQANSESTKVAVDAMRADITKLQADLAAAQADNGTLHQQVADLQAAFDKAQADRVKERQVLLETVAEMIKAGKSSSRPAKKKDPDAAASSLAPPPDVSPSPAGNGDAPAVADTDQPPASKPQKGYYHVVASGETLTLICNAYRQDGVNVSVAEVRKANGLTEGSILKVGQKLFIPKPGT